MAAARGMVAHVWQRTRVLLPQAADYRAMRRNPRRDILAGVTVAVVALPLALAFGAASGLGAGAGIVTAIVAGILAAVFGGSNLQVSGPTGAMTVVLLSGIRPGHDSIFSNLGVYRSLATQKHVFESTPEAIEHARVHVARDRKG